jgi:hypothetical protein
MESPEEMNAAIENPKPNEDVPDYFPFKSDGQPSKAREEGFFDSLQIFCCPKLKIT